MIDAAKESGADCVKLQSFSDKYISPWGKLTIKNGTSFRIRARKK